MIGAVRPTKKQQELLLFIEQFIGEHGYSPSYREIMNGCKYTSVATVALHVGNLIKRGHLRKRDHSARSIEVVKDVALDVAEPNSVNAQNDEVGSTWLLSQTEQAIGMAERAADLSRNALNDLLTLLNTCRLLGLEAESEPLRVRYEVLAQKQYN